MLSNIGPDIENEMDEIQRASQDLSRDENIDISVEEIIKSFENSKEEILSDEIWEKLENTESNEIDKGDVQSVFDIAKKYNKTNPRKLARSLKSDDYKRPLILNFEDRYILVAGNTRLSTAAAMGMNPKVFIARVKIMKEEVNNIKGGLSDNKTIEQIAKKHSKKENFEEILSVLKKQLSMGMKVEMEHTKDKTKAKEIAMDHLYEDPKYYSKLKKIETKEQTTTGSSGSYSAPLFSTIKKPITKIHNNKNYNINENKDEVKMSDLIGKKFKYVVGSGTLSSIEPNTEEFVSEQIIDAIKHYLFDWEFYYNWSDNGDEYRDFFKENILKKLMNNVDETLQKYFIIDKSKNTVEWKPNRKENRKIIDNYILNSKKLSNQIKKEYVDYRDEYADVKLNIGGNIEGEFSEATLSSSSGQYDVPFGKGGKNPLKIDGEKSIKNSRAVKDKDFPKWGGPESVFIKIKEKCKKFPYCNQGIDAIELLEIGELNEVIKETSNKYRITEKEMKTLVLNEIKKIFI